MPPLLLLLPPPPKKTKNKTLQVAERLGLLAELQRVAVLFVGLCFETVGAVASSANATADCSGINGGGSKLRPLPAVAGGSNSGSRPGNSSGHAGSPMGGKAGGRGEEGGEGEGGSGGCAAQALGLLQGSFSLLQRIVAGHGGVIKELSVDDKGTVRHTHIKMALYYYCSLYGTSTCTGFLA